MSDHLDLRLRTASAFGMAHEAVGALERIRVWLTALNYELALHYVGDPAGPLAKAVDKLLSEGELHSDDFSEKLAREFLPRVRLQTEISDTGGALTRQLEQVATVLDDACHSHAKVAGAMGAASQGLAATSTIADAFEHIRVAAIAVNIAESRATEHKAQLEAAAAEVHRLQCHLERIQRDALTDPLTGLGNRRAFEQDMERAYAESVDTGAPLTLAMIDIDNFKRFNDTWGHQTGDQIIRFIASVICARCGSATHVRAVRRGGVRPFFYHERNVRSATRHLEELNAEVARRSLRRRETGEDLGYVTVSVGLAQFVRGETSAELIGRADAALYASKRSGA